VLAPEINMFNVKY